MDNKPVEESAGWTAGYIDEPFKPTSFIESFPLFFYSDIFPIYIQGQIGEEHLSLLLLFLAFFISCFILLAGSCVHHERQRQ